MHEVSLALAIFETVKDILEKNDCREVKELEIELGELTMITPLQLKSAIETISEDESAFKNCSINVTKIEPVFKCKKCNYSWKPNLGSRSPMMSHLENFSCVHCMDTYFANMCCTKCGSDDVEITSGKECVLKGVKMAK